MKSIPGVVSAVAWAARLAACAGLAGVAQGQAVTESETDGQGVNNTLGTAQLIQAASFLPNTSATVFGNSPTAVVNGRGGAGDVDFYRFSVPVRAAALFDIDNSATGLDSYLALFSAGGTLLADADDSFPPDPGSTTDRDAFIGAIVLDPGDYFIAVAAFGNFADATFTGPDGFELQRPDGAFGGFAFPAATPGVSTFAQSGTQAGLAYTLNISVPTPGSLAPLAAFGLLTSIRRRRA